MCTGHHFFSSKITKLDVLLIMDFREKEQFDQVIQDIDFSGQSLQGYSFEDCHFINCNFTGARLLGVSLGTTTFDSCNFSSTDITRAKLTNVRFTGCKLMGINFSIVHTMLFSVSFDACRIQHCIFENLKLSGLEAEGNEILETDFTGCNLQKARFGGSDLRGSQFVDNDLKEADFRSASNYSIDPTQNQVKGARFSLPEAVGLLEVFQVKIG
jgi:fluoroquinolone resistance protein